MPDMEKVIKGLELCTNISQDGCLMLCPYKDEKDETYSGFCEQVLKRDALSLLKDQNWVKCSDRMPEEHETIFAKFKGTDKWSPAMFAQSSEDVRVVIVFADGTRRVSHSHTIDGKWECEKSPVKRTVTHWMPNPRLPEEGR